MQELNWAESHPGSSRKRGKLKWELQRSSDGLTFYLCIRASASWNKAPDQAVPSLSVHTTPESWNALISVLMVLHLSCQ